VQAKYLLIGVQATKHGTLRTGLELEILMMTENESSQMDGVKGLQE